MSDFTKGERVRSIHHPDVAGTVGGTVVFDDRTTVGVAWDAGYSTAQNPSSLLRENEQTPGDILTEIINLYYFGVGETNGPAPDITPCKDGKATVVVAGRSYTLALIPR